MSYRLRLVARGAEGREIVREQRRDGDVLSVGRAPDNDLVLADLAVADHHLVLHRDGADHVRIETAGEHRLVVDGRRRRRDAVRVSLGAATIVELGRHNLALARDGDDVLVTVTEDAAREVDAARAFSLGGTLPSRRALAWVGALAVLALFLAWPIWSFTHARIGDPHASNAGERALSVGPLTRAHAALEGNCKACHAGAFVAVADASCSSCHKDVHLHADPARLAAAQADVTGFAALKRQVAVTFGRAPGRCVDCHQEHQGAEATMTSADQRFCSDCHGALKSRLSTPLGNAADFGTAHPQFRPLVQTVAAPQPRLSRVSLDADPKEDSGLKFPHALHLSQTGGVARMAQTMGKGLPACADCHVPDRDGVRFRPVSMEAQCEGCHALGYDRVGGTVRRLRHGDVAAVIADLTANAGIRGNGGYAPSQRRRPGSAGAQSFGPGGLNAAQAIRATFSRGGACFDCHVVKGSGTSWMVQPVRQTSRYLQHGWFDHDAHREQTCESCHVGARTSRTATDLLLPGIATCRTCHGGGAAAAPKVASTCTMCHDYHRSDLAPRAVRRRQSTAPLRIAWAD